MHEFYAIQHTPTKQLLPSPSGRGSSHVEFGDPGIPRLFREKRHAKSALTYWLRGLVTVNAYQRMDGDWDEDWRLEPKPHRIEADCEVVPITISVGTETG